MLRRNTDIAGTAYILYLKIYSNEGGFPFHRKAIFIETDCKKTGSFVTDLPHFSGVL